LRGFGDGCGAFPGFRCAPPRATGGRRIRGYKNHPTPTLSRLVEIAVAFPARCCNRSLPLLELLGVEGRLLLLLLLEELGAVRRRLRDPAGAARGQLDVVEERVHDLDRRSVVCHLRDGPIDDG